MSFSFGSPANPPKTTSGFILPAAGGISTASATPTTSGGFSFNVAPSLGAASGDKPTGGSLFSAAFKPAATTQPSSLAMNLSQPIKTTASTLNFGTPVAQNTVQPALASGGLTFSLGAGMGTGNTAKLPTTTTTPSLSFGFGTATPVASTTAATTFTPILGGTRASIPSSTPATGLTFGSPVTTSTAPKLSLGGTTTTAVTTTTTSSLGFSLGGTVPISTVAQITTTSTTSIGATIPSITFAQLEDSINKWTIDLEEQGKFFVNQAKQLNAWDSLLISNGEKILNLNSTIGRVKQQQSQLDQELDFILAQQKELEELIVPLEKELADVPVTDIDRNQMYQFAEIIDSQLKQISDDLKEIIENINESNRGEEESNPITQISKILNAHMDSLQWIDRNTAHISRQLEEISKIEETNRINLSLNNTLSMYQ
ncbi:nuclear pore glycoprotein p62 [Euwallacea fornicatus]|uniref:nuclear pore glycoprotein p62 n=1 Tax=Euwallacea fornicatus TaxID=995702 RepID=UPI00338D95EA